MNGVAYYNDKFIIAKRKGVTEYGGYWEFVPSGGISLENMKKNSPCKEQINEEFIEELGINVNMENIRPFYLLFDKKHELWGIGCLIKLNFELNIDDLKSKEYSEFKIIEKKDIGDFIKNNKFVPISEAIFYLLDTQNI